MCPQHTDDERIGKCVKSPFGKGEDGKHTEVTFAEHTLTLAS